MKKHQTTNPGTMEKNENLKNEGKKVLTIEEYRKRRFLLKRDEL